MKCNRETKKLIIGGFFAISISALIIYMFLYTLNNYNNNVETKEVELNWYIYSENVGLISSYKDILTNNTLVLYKEDGGISKININDYLVHCLEKDTIYKIEIKNDGWVSFENCNYSKKLDIQTNLF